MNKNFIDSYNVDLCRKLTDGAFLYDHIPTKKPRDYVIHYEKQEWTLVDIGGAKRERMHWRFHLLGAHGVIFMIDAADKTKFPDVKVELERLISHEHIKASVVYIFLNKKDLTDRQPMNENDILLNINLSHRTLREYNINYYFVSIMTGEGLESAFEQLYKGMNDHIERSMK